MGDTGLDAVEVRFVIEPELTHCYINYQHATGDRFDIAQGWHFKTFPASMSVLDIMNAWAEGREQPLMWPQHAPT